MYDDREHVYAQTLWIIPCSVMSEVGLHSLICSKSTIRAYMSSSNASTDTSGKSCAMNELYVCDHWCIYVITDANI